MFTETGATQAIKTNQTAELKQQILAFSNSANQISFFSDPANQVCYFQIQLIKCPVQNNEIKYELVHSDAYAITVLL